MGQKRGLRTLALLDFTAALSLVEELSKESLPNDVCRGIGVDFGSGGARLYVAGRYFTWADIERGLARFGQPVGPHTTRPFNRFVLNVIAPSAPLTSMLLGLVLSKEIPGDHAMLKLDAFLPELKVDDQASSEAMAALCAAVGIDPAVLLPAWSIMAGGRSPDETVGTQQFVSLDVAPNGASKVNLYYRPMELAAAQALPRAKPTAEAHLDLVIKSAIAALERERKAGYPEATQRMIFPRAAGFSGESDEQAGCVFQRALIAEALLESAAAGFHIDWNGIDEDVEELVALRCADVAGGWRYFPGLPELPPDADDLAIILRLLVRLGHPARGRPLRSAAPPAPRTGTPAPDLDRRRRGHKPRHASRDRDPLGRRSRRRGRREHPARHGELRRAALPRRAQARP